MRRPQRVKRNSPIPEFKLPFGADQREERGPRSAAPFPSYLLVPRVSGRICQGRDFCGLRTLDRFFPTPIIQFEGKGAGGLRGLAPWRSLRQRLMRAPGALSAACAHSDCILPCSALFPCASLELSEFFPLHLPASLCRFPPCFHPHSGWTRLGSGAC